MDVLLLSRLQFALTIMFHYLFPPLTIGLGVVLVFLEARHLWTRDPAFHAAAKFWTKIFGLNFALGVVTGIVMEFEFGTNWAVYSRYVGDVFGSALAAEGIFAFFLESGFLSILLFGWDRVGPKMHFFSTLMVCVGGIFSAVWIVVANSWQQTPAGFEIREHVVNGIVTRRAEITDFWAMLLNPSSLIRLAHTINGAFVLGAFFVMSITAWYLLKGRHRDFAERSFRGGLLLGTVASLGQLALGHIHAEEVAEYQPAKLAAFEGHFKTGPGAHAYLFGWPDEEAREVKWGLAIPSGLSLLIHQDPDGVVKGLDELEPVYGSPPVWLAFQSYHLMVVIGMTFIGMTLAACFFLWRGTLFSKRWFLWCFVFAVLPAFAANEAGWVAAEVGRQPWIVYPTVENGEVVAGLRTSDGLSEAVRAEQVLASIIFFGLVYSLLFVLWLFLLNHKIQAGPEPVAEPAATATTGLVDAATNRPDHHRSLTDAKRPAAREGSRPPQP